MNAARSALSANGGNAHDPDMLAVATRRVREVGAEADVRQADAGLLDFVELEHSKLGIVELAVRKPG